MATTSSFSAYEKSYDVENNTSVVRVSISVTTTGGSYNNYGMTFSVTCNGSTHSSTMAVGYNTTKTYSYDFTVTHDNDGSKTVSCSGSVVTGISAGTLTGSKSLTLTTIPRASELTAGNGTLGTAQTLSITKKDSSYKHKIVYVDGDSYVYISGSASTFTNGTSVSWTPPLSLASRNPNGTSVSITIKLYTYNSSGTQIGNPSTKTISCTIPNTSDFQPTCSIALSEPSGQDHVSIYGGYIQGKSIIHCEITASGAYGATISSYYTSIGGSVYTSSSFDTSFPVTAGYLNTASYRVTDSRGRTSGVAARSYTVIPYSAPKISKLSVTRCDDDGTENDRGSYVKVTYSYAIATLFSGGLNRNTPGATIKYKKTSDSSWTSVARPSNYSVTDATYIFQADDASSYDVELQLTDDFYTGNNAIKSQTSVSTAFCIFHIKPDGHGITFGGISSNDGFHVKMDADFEGDISIDGDSSFGGDAHFTGASTFGGAAESSGFNVKQDAHFFNGLTEDIQVLNSGDCNNILESGNYYLGSSTTNRPVATNGWLTVKTYSASSNYCYQEYVTYTGLRYYRLRISGTWNSWTRETSIVKLWENSSPSSSFAAQTISLTLTNYDSVLVEAYMQNNYQYIVSTFADVGQTGFLVGYWGVDKIGCHRRFIVSATGVEFTNAGYNGSSSSTAVLIPYRIYGVAGVIDNS